MTNKSNEDMVRAFILPLDISIDLERGLGRERFLEMRKRLLEWCQNEIDMAFSVLKPQSLGEE